MPNELSPAELDRFDRDGFIGPFDVYDGEEMRNAYTGLRISLMDRRRAIYDLEAGGNIANYDRHLDIEFLFNHIHRPEIVDRVKCVLGPNVLCWRTEFFVKYPGDEGTDWHQSRSLAVGSGVPALVPTQLNLQHPEIGTTLTVWTALTEASRETSCMQYIPGSHKLTLFDDKIKMRWEPDKINKTVKNGIRRGLFGYDARDMQVDPSWSPDERSAYCMELKSGHSAMFWEATAHASTPNVTKDKTRLALVARYVPTSVRVYPDQTTLSEYGGSVNLEKWRAVLVCGEDTFGHNKLLDRTAAR